MQRQKQVWSCGAAVVRNVLRVFGIKVAEHDIYTASCTDPEKGTDEYGIVAAIRDYGLSAVEYRYKVKSEAWTSLCESLDAGKPVIMCTENWEHWVLAIGKLGNMIAYFDSSNFKKNTNENGCYVVGRKKVLNMLWNDRKGEDLNEGRIYFISVSKK